jgi:hypothetical protein
MAFGTCCIHCGRQERDHELINEAEEGVLSEEEAEETLPERKYSLFECVSKGEGFTSESPEIEARMAEE